MSQPISSEILKSLFVLDENNNPIPVNSMDEWEAFMKEGPERRRILRTEIESGMIFNRVPRGQSWIWSS